MSMNLVESTFEEAIELTSLPLVISKAPSVGSSSSLLHWITYKTGTFIYSREPPIFYNGKIIDTHWTAIVNISTFWFLIHEKI